MSDNGTVGQSDNQASRKGAEAQREVRPIREVLEDIQYYVSDEVWECLEFRIKAQLKGNPKRTQTLSWKPPKRSRSDQPFVPSNIIPFCASAPLREASEIPEVGNG